MNNTYPWSVNNWRTWRTPDSRGSWASLTRLHGWSSWFPYTWPSQGLPVTFTYIFTARACLRAILDVFIQVSNSSHCGGLGMAATNLGWLQTINIPEQQLINLEQWNFNFQTQESILYCISHLTDQTVGRGAQGATVPPLITRVIIHFVFGSETQSPTPRSPPRSLAPPVTHSLFFVLYSSARESRFSKHPWNGACF